MRYLACITTVFILAGLTAAPAWTQEKASDAVTIELTRPGEPCHVACALVYGGIVVETHTGKTVIVETRTQASAEKLEKIEAHEAGKGYQGPGESQMAAPSPGAPPAKAVAQGRSK